jgi:hypothetical protein
MPPQTCVRRLSLILSLVLASTTAPALAANPSPRRQADLDAVVARRHSFRQQQAAEGARRRAALASQVQYVLSYEMAMEQSNARYQMAAAQASYRWMSRSAESGQYPQPPYAASPVVFYPPYSTGWTTVTPAFAGVASHAAPNASAEAPMHQAGHPAHHGTQHP